MNSIAKILKHTDLLLGIGLITIVAMLILPLPHWTIDLGLVIGIAASVLILMSAVNATDPIQFSVFPSMLLMTTLLRLALSIAATKAILGTGEAGRVIETFGSLIMGGDFVVGFVAFLILVIVQFVVITNGAGRVSEVAARFTLDAMPGRQMAIDADLAAGMIDEHEARDRRKQIKKEADFYGAMDGASKFVKGDAIAAILIILINIIGGFAVGFMRGGGDAMTILKTYALLSVGEGLVAQLPALLISTASGLLVTRAGQERSMGGELASQILAQPKALQFSGIALSLMGLVPGFPATIFFLMGGGLIALAQFMKKNPNAIQAFDSPETKAKQDAATKAANVPAVPAGPEAVLPLLTVDPLELEIGYNLTKLADPRVGGDLPDRVTSTRKQLAIELGIVMPTVRIRDSIHLKPSEYVLKVRGEEVARSEVHPEMCLAVNSGDVLFPIHGNTTKDPVFGLDALWIDKGQAEMAERAGYTVIQPCAVLSTHLSEVVKSHSAELLTRQDVQQLLENAKAQNETVVTELVPNVLQVGDIQKVLQHLLREKVPIRDMVTILETMADFGGRVKDPDQLGELVRSAIARTITRQFLDDSNRLYCITLEPSLERDLAEKVNVTTYGSVLVLEPGEQKTIVDNLKSEVDRAMTNGYQAVLLCSNQLRLPLKRVVDKYVQGLSVLAYTEISEKADVEFVGQVRAA
ncbi:MAG: flagellar biosynthesis protein FlhA [Fimbriimonadaceae bacterium]|nr:flagellar biosynthesis protein FlhA [Fimbriimonadaceae bacterium]